MSGKLYSAEETLTAEHAVVFQSRSDLQPMDYVKAIASVIGSNQIHSVYDNGEACKVYLKDKKFVHTIIESGVILKGHLMPVDYNVPPGTKICLLNVDPVLPSWSLECVLSFYGTFETSIMRQKISAEVGFSHIEGSTRTVYMKIFLDKKLPNKIPVFHAGMLHEVEVCTPGSKNYIENNSETEFNNTI